MPDQTRVLQGLAREDLFTVVFEQVMTDTARCADVVLPATTFLEHYDFARGYGAIACSWSRPVIDPVGEARSNADVFAELCQPPRLVARRRLAVELDTLLDDARPAAARDRRRRLATRGVAAPPGTAAPVQFVDVFPRTPDRKSSVPAGARPGGPAGPVRLPARPATARSFRWR